MGISYYQVVPSRQFNNNEHPTKQLKIRERQTSASVDDIIDLDFYEITAFQVHAVHPNRPNLL